MNLVGTALVVLALAGYAPPNRLKPGLQTNGGSWRATQRADSALPWFADDGKGGQCSRSRVLPEGRDTLKRGLPRGRNPLGVHALTCPGLLTGSLIQRPRSLRLATLVRAGPGLLPDDAVEGTTGRRVRV